MYVLGEKPCDISLSNVFLPITSLFIILVPNTLEVSLKSDWSSVICLRTDFHTGYQWYEGITEVAGVETIMAMAQHVPRREIKHVNVPKLCG